MAATLTGTEKQVAYATDIRAFFEREVDALVAESARGDQVWTRTPGFAPVYQQRAMIVLEQAAEAKWWIERRQVIVDAKAALRTRAERLGTAKLGEDSWSVEIIRGK